MRGSSNTTNNRCNSACGELFPLAAAVVGGASPRTRSLRSTLARALQRASRAYVRRGSPSDALYTPRLLLHRPDHRVYPLMAAKWTRFKTGPFSDIAISFWRWLRLRFRVLIMKTSYGGLCFIAGIIGLPPEIHTCLSPTRCVAQFGLYWISTSNFSFRSGIRCAAQPNSGFVLGFPTAPSRCVGVSLPRSAL